MLIFSDKDIRRQGPGHALAACWRQWRMERKLTRRGIHFRASDPQTVAAAYAAMSDQEFDAVNARQDWANWRTIPRALNGHIPDRPLQILDLGCGTGSSTRVLAFYCPQGSRIIGYEMVPRLLEIARRRTYVQRGGAAVPVEFVCQRVTQPWRRPDGNLIPDRSLDLVNASGVVGHHLNAETVLPLIQELQRALTPDGSAMLDVGPSLPAHVLVQLMAAEGFLALGRCRSWLFDPTGEVVFRRKVR